MAAEQPVRIFQVVQPFGGGLIAALDDTVVVMRDDGTEQRTIATVDHADERLRLNEGKCDPFGAFVVGATDPEGSPVAGLYRVAPDGTLTQLRDDFATTNGFEWNDDGSEIYLTDTGDDTIYRASWDADGTLGELVPFSSQGAHDGLARSINPIHTMTDGDTLFALGTGASGLPGNVTTLGTIAAEVTDPDERQRAWAIIGRRHTNLAAVSLPDPAETAIMAAKCRHLSVVDYTRGLGHSDTVTVE